jgi:hypothetical protein
VRSSSRPPLLFARATAVPSGGAQFGETPRPWTVVKVEHVSAEKTATLSGKPLDALLGRIYDLLCRASGFPRNSVPFLFEAA